MTADDQTFMIFCKRNALSLSFTADHRQEVLSDDIIDMPIPLWLDRVAQVTFNGLLPFLRRSSFHSKTQSCLHSSSMQVHVLPALSDNYMYLLVDEKTKEAAIVDPVEPDKVAAAVQEQGLKLSTVLTTHHHWDHAGGNEGIAAKFPDLVIVGGDQRVPAMNRPVKQGDKLKIGNLDIECLATPCHTSGHICYFVTSSDNGVDPAVFTGDTLFIAGCGKFFEGTADQMYTALIDKLSSLPDATRVYCGHEYTENNLKFAVTVEPENQEIHKLIAWSRTRREADEPTVPSSIGQEKLLNPFMRVNEPSLQRRAGASNAIETMACLRKEKDNFRPKA